MNYNHLLLETGILKKPGSGNGKLLQKEPGRDPEPGFPEPGFIPAFSRKTWKKDRETGPGFDPVPVPFPLYPVPTLLHSL